MTKSATKHPFASFLLRCYDHTNSCFLMLLSNLATPVWVSENCDTKFLTHSFCFQNTNEDSDAETPQNTSSPVCPQSQILKDTKCYLFIWFHESQQNASATTASCAKHGNVPTQATDLNTFEFIFKATAQFPALISQSITENFSAHLEVFQYEKFQNTFVKRNFLAANTDAKGFYICTGNSEKVTRATNLFFCVNGESISKKYLCDGTIDCPNDNSDEVGCMCEIDDVSHVPTTCKELVTKQEEEPRCSFLYFVDRDRNCHKFERNIHNGTNPQRKLFLCSDGLQIDLELKNDLFPDCTNDEPLILEKVDFIMENMVLGHTCSLPHQLPCLQGYPRCYNVTDICIFQLRGNKYLEACRNGGHLMNCKQFECNKMFKCKDSYCIPWSFVCDGKLDCPNSDDESYSPICQKTPVCLHMYKCREVNTCVHLANVCDTHEDCLHLDDEIFCKVSQCPFECQCLLYATLCWSLNYNQEPSSKSSFQEGKWHHHISVAAVSSFFSNLTSFLHSFPDLTQLTILRSDIKDLCRHTLSVRIMSLDVKFTAL